MKKEMKQNFKASIDFELGPFCAFRKMSVVSHMTKQLVESTNIIFEAPQKWCKNWSDGFRVGSLESNKS